MSTAHADVVRAFLDAGCALIQIPLGSKGPTLRGWNRREHAIFEHGRIDELAGCNVGLLHAWSRTVAVDIDDYDAADEYLTARGISLESLFLAEGAVSVSSGKPNKAKLLYRLPDGVTCPPTRQILDATGRVILEFRCASNDGLSVQDVIAGRHPEGTTYTVTGDPATMPTLPAAIRDLWRTLLGNGKGHQHHDQHGRDDAKTREGGRNAMLTREAGKLRRLGLSVAPIEAALHAINAERCDPPLPHDEVATIARSVGRYGAPLERDREIGWDRPAPITRDEFDRARLTPDCIVEDYLFADVALLVAPGSTGKTTLTLYEAIHVALGRMLYGLRILKPGFVVIVTAEDSREMLVARLRRICEAMQLRPSEIEAVIANILIDDVSGRGMKLTAIDNDVVVPSMFAELLIEGYRDTPPVLIVIDPAVSFGVGEQRVNDAEQGLVEAARRIRTALNCCVRFIHHSGKQNARDKTVDQYSGRGGSAFADGARMVHVLQPMTAKDWLDATGSTLLDGETGMVLARPKTSYCPPQGDILLSRKGYSFSHTTRVESSPEARLASQADQLLRFVEAGLPARKHYTQRNLEDIADALGMTRREVRAAVASLLACGRLTHGAHHPVPVHGARTFLAPVGAPPDSGVGGDNHSVLWNDNHDGRW